jgi:cold shock CspA family protein
MEKGTITSLKDKFGFIACKGYPRDIFFHADDLEGLEFGPQLLQLAVQFRIESRQKGPRAIEVRPAT